MPWMALIPAAISAGTAIAGQASASGKQQQAFDAAQQAYDQILAVGAPPNLAKQILLEQYQKAGTLTPALAQYINSGPSQVANMQENPAMKNAQLQALAQMQQRANGGMQPSDYAAYIQAQQQIAGEGQAKQNQILQEMASRGLEGRGNSGAELAARLSGAQNANNQQMRAGLDIAGQASQNALNAIAQSANMAGQVRNTDFNQALQKAQAADAFNKFNTQNQLAVQAMNNQNQNAANAYNMQNAQNIANANTQQANNELYREANARQQYWDSLMGQAQAQANALLGKSGVYNSQAQYSRDNANAIGGGLAAGAQAYNNYQQGQANQDFWKSILLNNKNGSGGDGQGYIPDTSGYDSQGNPGLGVASSNPFGSYGT